VLLFANTNWNKETIWYWLNFVIQQTTQIH